MSFESWRQLRQYRNNRSIFEYWGTAPPSASTDQGPFNVGDIVWNTAPSAASGSYVGWVCTTAGTNGATAVFSGFGLFQSAATAITAGTTRTQAGATALTATINRVDTSTAVNTGTTLGDGVVLPSASSIANAEIVVINNTANIIQVYGNGSDTINGIAGATGIPIPPGDVARFESATAGDWRVEAGVGSAGALPLMLAADSITAAGSTRAGATALPADYNRVLTATALQGVSLPASAGGLDVFVANHSGVNIVVYALGSDTIDDIAGATGVTVMPNSVVLFTSYAAGKWYSEGLATGYAGNGLQTVQFADSITAAGTTQGTATQLVAAMNNVTTVASGTGVNLPASSAGLSIVVQNNGANALLVYPFQGATDTINGVAATQGVVLFPGAVGVFNCTTAGAWTVQPASTHSDAFNTASNTTGFTATAAQVSGGVATVAFALTGTLGSGQNLQLPTVANLVAALHAPTVGTSYRLRIINESGGAFSWTVTTNTGWTLTGTVTIAQNTWREFTITLNSLTTATLQNVGTGTFS